MWESRKKIRQRESEKAKSLPGTLKISYTFIRYISIDFGIDKNEMKRLVIALAELDLTIDEWLCFKMKELILADRLSKENRGEE